jgi:trehalose 6-phosphate phosphatase
MTSQPGGDGFNVPEPRTEAGRAGWAALRSDPRHALVALDFDGTLSPIVTEPAAARLADGGLPVLRRLAGSVGTLVVITGRPAATVVELGGLDAVPGLLVEGQYGAEQWRAGRLRVADPPPGIATVRALLPGVLADAGADPAVWVEDKALALVVHTRRAGDPAAAQAALAEPVRRLAEAHGLEMHPGRYVLEIRPPGHDKGGVLRTLAADRRPAAVLFAGDDVGDLPAFEAVEALRAAGLPGLTVCSGSAEAAAVAERADLVVDGPPGVLALLDELAAVTLPGTPMPTAT